MKRLLAGLTCVTLFALGGTGWLCRDTLKARYYTHNLLAISDAEVDAWVEQAPDWGNRVPDRLIDCLTTADATARDRAGAALKKLPAAAITGRLAERFSQLSAPGQQTALNCVADRPMIRLGLQSPNAGVRLRAAASAMEQPDLLIPLLKDSDAEVRRAAVVAVAPSRELISDDDLLAWLQDPDAEVRRLTENGLRNRGLRSIDVRMGRLLTDPRPASRLELLVLLSDDSELDLNAWLKRLCDDPSPAVRAAAIRLADDRQVLQLTTRLAEMAKADPDLTVRQTARYHLAQLQPSVRPVRAP